MNTLKVVNGVLMLALAYDYRIATKNRTKYAAILEENNHLKDHILHAQFMVGYLAKKLEEHEIEIDEFDMIVLNNPM